MSTPSSALPVSATQVVAGCAVVIALLGAAYAVGRSQAPAAAAAPAPSAAATTGPQAQPAPPHVSLAQAGPQGKEAPAAPCARCGTVVDVRTERREGQASGLGAVGGAVVGGILGHQVGGGIGKQIATVGGAVAGGYAGNQIEKNHKARTVWIVQVRTADGGTRRFERSVQPDVRAGDEVLLTDQGFSRR